MSGGAQKRSAVAPGSVETARGPVPLSSLGPVLSHEHLFINLMAERRGDGLLHDEALMARELAVFAKQGGGAIFDLTTAELTPGSTLDSERSFDARRAGQTRNPRAVEAVRRVSEATGVHVVLGTGRYRDPFLDPQLIAELGVAGLAAEMVHDLTVGFADTGIRAGLIGEVGADKWFISEVEEQVFRAAAAASVQTGAPVYTHAARWTVGVEQSELLVSCGVAPEKIAIGHVDTVPSVDYAVELAARGHYVGIDTIYSTAPAALEHRVAQVLALVRAGHRDRILLAHDVCVASLLQANGGPGFGLVMGEFRAALLAAGIGEDEFRSMMVENPARYLAPSESGAAGTPKKRASPSA